MLSTAVHHHHNMIISLPLSSSLPSHHHLQHRDHHSSTTTSRTITSSTLTSSATTVDLQWHNYYRVQTPLPIIITNFKLPITIVTTWTSIYIHTLTRAGGSWTPTVDEVNIDDFGELVLIVDILDNTGTSAAIRSIQILRNSGVLPFPWRDYLRLRILNVVGPANARLIGRP